MRYIYFPKLLKDLENMEQYNELLPHGFSATNASFNRIKTLGFWDTYFDGCYTNFLSSVDGEYMRYCIAPIGSATKEYAETNDTVFYIYGSSQDYSLTTRKTLGFLIRALEWCLMCSSIADTYSYEKGEAMVVLLKQLVKDYESEDAFRKDILENYRFELDTGLFTFITINSNLDDLGGLAEAIYAPVKLNKDWDVCEFYTHKLLNVLNEIDFWVDSADYDQLVAYEYLLRDDFTHNNKQFSEIQNNTEIIKLLERRDEVRKHVVKAKQLVAQGRKMSLRLDDLILENIKPKNIKLHLQW